MKKLLYVAIDGMGDLPIKFLDGKTPLEAAETHNMDAMAQNGQTGLMYSVKQGVAPESDVAVISLLGYDPFKYSTGRGVIEAAGVGLNMKDGDLALRCNFATLGANKQIIDRRVGRSLSTQEAKELGEAVNEQVKLESYPATFEFKPTLGHRAVLLIRSTAKPLSSAITNSDPAYIIVNGIGVAKTDVEMVLKKSEPDDQTEAAAKVAAGLVNEFIEKSHALWENHPINLKRAAAGKLKANVVLTRDAGHLLPKFFNINQHYGVNFACLADMHAERGIAKLAGMDSSLLPPSSGNLQLDCEVRVKALLDALPKHDCLYIHLKGPDEPGHDGNCQLKTQIISAIDKYFFGPLLQQVSLKDTVICITSDHATPCGLKVHSDTPVPVLISGDSLGNGSGVKFCEREAAKGNLGLIARGCELMPKLMQLIKK
ncbi:MAG TPA: alkaline phosphatase family protein [Candidatus Deferrimicrobiaceae bacterium]|nr:alkaline phosphatase family protein [Candidatus Deferrimicrobiaceae bacterium]